jgi:hypothetical protein
MLDNCCREVVFPAACQWAGHNFAVVAGATFGIWLLAELALRTREKLKHPANKET